MKKYLQACELGGSIYGKKRKTASRDRSADGAGAGKDTIANYKKFFKTQMVNMDRVYKHDG